MRFVTTFMAAASLGIGASVAAPMASAGVVVGVSLPLPVVAPVILATVPGPTVYVNPALGFYAPGYYHGGFHGCYGCGSNYGYRAGYRGYAHPGFNRGAAFGHRR